MSRTLVTLLLAAPLLASAGETLTLEAALAEAERANPDLAVARARLDQARAAVGQARSAYLPQVRAAGAYTRNSEEAKLQLPVGYTVRDAGAPTSSSGLPGDPTSLTAVPTQFAGATIQARDQLTAQLDVTQAILAPSLWFAIDAAGASTRAAGATTEASRRELRLGVSQAYYAAAAAEQLVAIQERQVTVARAHERDAEVQVGAGQQARVTLLRATIERVRADEDLVRARNSVDSSRSVLAAFLGRSEVGDFSLVHPASPPLPQDLSRVEEEALRRRPELAAASAGIDAAAASQRSVTARYFPSVGAFGQARASNVAGFTGKEETWAAGLSLSWNLFDGGLREADRQRASARRAEAERSRDGALVRVLDEVRRARLDLASARANGVKAGEQVTLAQENQRLVQAAFRAGQATSLEATDANAALATAEIDLVRERLAADLAALRLLRAAGIS